MKAYRRIERKYVLCATTALCALAASAFAASPAHAATACDQGAIAALPVPGVTILSAADVPAKAPNPEFCDVIGTLNTSGDGAPPGSAGFELRLPAHTWNGKFLFFGVGGLAGSTYPDIATNGVDAVEALGKGYATAITDTGHLGGGTDASFALIRTGVPDRAKLTDYLYRATHEVTVAGKDLVEQYYGQSIAYAYFDGCSNGGHQAMAEASDYPNDYDGLISGAPFFDARAVIAGVRFNKQLLSSPSAFVLPSQLPFVDAAILASCDAADGVKDGLIQNPAACSFDPASLVCTAGNTTNCLTSEQADTLRTYFSAVHDDDGHVVYTGWTVSALTGGFDTWSLGSVPPSKIDFSAAEPWGNAGFSPATIAWQFADHIVKDIYARDPEYNIRDFPVSLAGVVSDAGLHRFDKRIDERSEPSSRGGFVPSPEDYRRFLGTGNKLLIWQGLADQALAPFRTMQLYEQLAQMSGGYGELSERARLFLAPGVHHCGGGPGPNTFDTLTAMENWVEKEIPPNGIIASHYPNNDPTKPADRTMPLCMFPEEAQYSGHGDVNQAANWSCTHNSRMLEVGADGREGGL